MENKDNKKFVVDLFNNKIPVKNIDNQITQARIFSDPKHRMFSTRLQAFKIEHKTSQLSGKQVETRSSYGEFIYTVGEYYEDLLNELETFKDNHGK